MSSVQERIGLARSSLIRNIQRVDLRVRDIDTSLGFYRDVVGLEVDERGEDHVSLRSPGGPVRITLDSFGVSRAADPYATGLFHVAIRLPTRASLGDALARLAQAGLEIGAGDHAVSEALYIDDPDGNGIELYWDRPSEQWPAPTPDAMVPMVTLPVDLQSLLDEGRGRAAVGLPAESGTDVGHVHLQVGEVDRTIRFYADALGLDLTGRLGGQAAFFSSNAYHHHIGANAWRSLGGTPAPKNRAGLSRIVFAVDNAEELESLRTRLESHGRELGVNDDGSAIVADPDDIELEFVPPA